MFTQPCFIRKNTSELRGKLSKIGYFESVFYCGDLSNLCVNVLGNGEYDEANNYAPLLCNAIDCGYNEDLFLAIAALRDDSNEHQWFIWDKEEGEKDNSNKWKLYDNNPDWSWWIFEVHKATVEELIEHFKSK